MKRFLAREFFIIICYQTDKNSNKLLFNQFYLYLFRNIQVTPELTVKDVMDTWTRQMGLPFINISITNTNGRSTVKAVQKRFLSDIDTNYDETESPYRYARTYSKQ